MSGYIAILHTDNQPVDAQLLQQLTEAMRFRGPDAHACRHSGPIGLGHTLLRTADDYPAARQPLSRNDLLPQDTPLDDDENVWIVADARIDGRADLLEQLRSQGHEPDVYVSDTALLLHAYLAWDEACLDHVIGDFGFVIWDGRTRKLFAAHDHFGVAPLYYAQTDSTLLISNTRQALRQHPAIRDELCAQVLGDYFLLGMNYDLTRTCDQDIRRLSAGQKLTWQAGACQISTYWQPGDPRHLLRYPRQEEYLEHFQTLFSQAVADRLRMPAISSHLSGGLDTSSIAVTAHRLLQQSGKPFDFRAYHIYYEELLDDQEAELSRKIAEKNQFPLGQFRAETYFFAEPEMPPRFQIPEPVAIANRTAEETILRHAAKRSRVLLVGLGGDPLLKASVLPLRGGTWGEWMATGKEIVRFAAAHRRMPPLALRQALARWVGAKPPHDLRARAPGWLNPDFAQKLDAAAREDFVIRNNQSGYRGMTRAALWQNIFAAGDPGATGILVKQRFPFFDRRLYDFLSSIPVIPWLLDKNLLRTTMQNDLPAEVLRRAKTPVYGLSTAAQLEQDATAPWVDAVLSAPRLAAYIDVPRLRKALDAPEVRSPQEIRRLTSALQFAYWLYYRE